MKVDFYISQSGRGNFAQACEAVISNVSSASKAATTAACKAILEDSLKQVPRDTGTLASTAWYHVESAEGRSNTGVPIRSSNRFVGYVGYAGSEREVSQMARVLAEDKVLKSAYGGGGGSSSSEPLYTTKFKKLQDKHYVGGSRYGSLQYNRKGKRNGTYGFNKVKGHGVQNAINPKTGLPASTYAPIVHEDLSMAHPRGGKAKFLEDPVRDYAASKFNKTLMHYWKYAIEWSNVFGNYGAYRISSTSPEYFETKIVGRGSVSWKGESL